MKVYRTKIPTPNQSRSKQRPNIPNVPKPSRRILAYSAIAGVIVIVGAVWGLTLLSDLSLFWDSIHGGAAAAQDTRHIVGAPNLYSLSPFTNKTKISIAGNGEPGAVVTIYRAGQKVADQLVGNDSQFVFNNISLKSGENVLTAKQSIDTSESPESSDVSTTLDTNPPKLSVDKPSDGSGSKTQYVFVSGKADVNSYVLVGDHQAVVGVDGSFNGVVQLQNGDNKVTISATDEAGNKTTVTRSVNYSP